ncbi:MAG: CPBP family intramembrane metalloprotease [Elusimicrobia bacterium]|nr:CPBP family intramembrane metalloprotease [Candidatus Obscuribacterium magneticum]MCB4755486.1 CPBP family intramembrane metalloprotease [Candidatus Obscuribacterium magneticum]
MRGRYLRWISSIEVAAFYALILSVIWRGEKGRPTILLMALVMLGLCVLSNWIHGDSLERVGLSKKNFWPNFKLVTFVSLPFLIPFSVLAILRRGPAEWNLWFRFVGYPVWAFAQDYALLGFVANRLENVFNERKSLIPWINGFLFSFVHWPNPLLMAATFLFGAVFTEVFFRRRHLIPIALAHALLGVLLSLSFGHIRGIMSVGPGYTRRIGTPYGEKLHDRGRKSLPEAGTFEYHSRKPPL